MTEPIKTKEPMHWDRLKDMRCPKDKCYGTLEKKEKGYECGKENCTFFIRTERFEIVINSLYESEKVENTRFGKRKEV